MLSHFYVDESGVFEDRLDAVTAGGLLLDDSNVDVRASLELAMPGFPWPLHAAHVNRPLVWALSAAASASEEQPLKSPFQEVLVALRRSQNNLVRQALVRLRRGEWPPYQTLLDLEAALREEAPSSFQALTTHVKHARTLVRRVGAALQGSTVVASEASWNIADVESARRRTGHEPTDRYYALLTSAIRRARDVVARRGGSRLLLTVLSRGVYSPEHRRMQLLTREDVETLIAELPPSPCAIEVQTIALWRADVPAPCVVADFCSNAARRVLRDPIRPLGTVEAQLYQQLGLSVRSGRPPKSHVAAAFPPGPGPWNDIQRAAPPTPPIGIRRWAWEQAVEQDLVTS